MNPWAYLQIVLLKDGYIILIILKHMVEGNIVPIHTIIPKLHTTCLYLALKVKYHGIEIVELVG
jgi:hypothetical protein